MSSEPDTEEVVVCIERETEKAYLFSSQRGVSGWFPKSEVYFKLKSEPNSIAIIPVWLLEQKGW